MEFIRKANDMTLLPSGVITPQPPAMILLSRLSGDQQKSIYDLSRSVTPKAIPQVLGYVLKAFTDEFGFGVVSSSEQMRTLLSQARETSPPSNNASVVEGKKPRHNGRDRGNNGEKPRCKKGNPLSKLRR
jgi:hypothetical protein